MCLITVRASEANKRIVAQGTCNILCCILHDMEKSVQNKGSYGLSCHQKILPPSE